MPDSTVTLVISSGAPDVVVPDVFGATIEGATGQLNAVGLGAQVASQTVSVDDPALDQRVVMQTPAAGASVDAGTTVTITIGVLHPSDRPPPTQLCRSQRRTPLSRRPRGLVTLAGSWRAASFPRWSSRSRDGTAPLPPDRSVPDPLNHSVLAPGAGFEFVGKFDCRQRVITRRGERILQAPNTPRPSWRTVEVLP